MPNIWKRLGPGILLAATCIGASHLVHAPRAGALFGFNLLWLVLASHLFKYPAFEFGPRYAAATGEHLVKGYARVPGPRNWALYLFLASTVLQGIGVLAAVVNVAGCVIATWTGDPGATIGFGVTRSELFSLGIIALVLQLIVAGGFNWLDHINKLMMAILALATVLAFVPVLPEPSAAARLVIPSLPEGSIVLVAAILGWMPTGIDVSIWHSFWTLQKLRHLGENTRSSSAADHRRQLRTSLFDMRVGYGLSLLTGIMFLCLGAIHLTGRGADLSGVQFAEAISSAYTAIFGRWMYHVFMLTAFFAMFSTSYVVIDGFSRSFSETLAVIRPRLSSARTKRKTLLGFMFFSAAFAAAMIVWVGNPITLVVAVSLVSLAVAPVLYGLSLYCVQHHIDDPQMKPHKLTVVVGWTGVAFVAVALTVTIYTKFFNS
ncbi:MAG: Nramp family divalent metal transporter [Deltaproteobacteria bacterium]|nr:Nramp family divalent metal transporter [Deltaproteobacteria bacterium]